MEGSMLDDAGKALSQMLSPPLRAVLWKSIGLALALIVVVAIALDRLIVWLVGAGSAAIENGLGRHAHTPAAALAWILSVAAGLGIVVGSVFLMPAVTAFVASFFADQIAEEVEREYYPTDPPGVALPLWLALLEGGRTALLAVVVYIVAAVLLIFLGFGAVVFFLATAWLLGRIYFHLAALRFRPPLEVKALRKRNAGTVYLAGLLIAAFVSIPIVNLETPLFGMSLMVHVHKRLGKRGLMARQAACPGHNTSYRRSTAAASRRSASSHRTYCPAGGVVGVDGDSSDDRFADLAPREASCFGDF